MSEKSAEALKTIGEVAKELNLIELETGKAKTYILRFWEKEFPQLKPKLAILTLFFFSSCKVINSNMSSTKFEDSTLEIPSSL